MRSAAVAVAAATMPGGRRHESATVYVALGWRSLAAAAAVPGDEPRAPPLASASFQAAPGELREPLPESESVPTGSDELRVLAPASGSVPAAPGGLGVPVTVTEAVPVPATAQVPVPVLVT